MPANHAVVAALPISAPANSTLLRNLLVQRMAYAVDGAAEAADLVAVDPVTGGTIPIIVCLGRNYLYDPADTTTGHDGVTCLVTSDGKRYKLAAGSDVLCYSVLDRTNTPPGSPALGGAYLITAAPTGDWAGHPDEIGVFTAHDWEFITPEIGRMIYVEDEDGYYRKKPDGTVSNGFGANALSSSSVLPSHMLGGGGRVVWPIENQTTNTPPAVADGVAYIVGPVPTGVWAGHAGKIAHGESGQWIIYPPSEGWIAYDKALDALYKYTGAAWASQTGRFRCLHTLYTSSSTFSKNARCIGVIAYVVGGGGGARGASGNGDPGETSSFGAHCSATGGGGGTASAGGAGGVGSGSDFNETGEAGCFFNGTVTSLSFVGGAPPGAGTRGRGGGMTVNDRAAGGGGGRARKWIPNSSLGATETVTVGAGGASGGAGSNGTAGYVLVLQFIEE